MSKNPQVTCPNLRVMNSNTRVTGINLWVTGPSKI